MTDEEREQQEQEEQQTPAIKAIREAEKRARADMKTAQDAQQAAEKELIELKSSARTERIGSILKAQGLPEKVSSVYPVDAEVSEELVKTFAQELGVVANRPEIDGWGRYDQITSGAVPPPQENEFNKLVGENEAAMMSWRDWFADPAKDGDATRKAFTRAQQLQDQFEGEVLAGRMNSLVNPEGFGGLIDPPAHARAWKRA